MKKVFAKSLIALFLVLCLIPSAYAGTSTSGNGSHNVSSSSDLQERLSKAPAFKFDIHSGGIGYGSCPVYTAPSEDAFRCANGKAACDTNAKMSEAGFDKTGWLLVRYDTNNGGSRIGYVPPGYVKGFKSVMQLPSFEYIPATAAETLYVTDNLYVKSSSFTTLSPGKTFYILGKYTYPTAVSEFWYIECDVDGQISVVSRFMRKLVYSSGE